MKRILIALACLSTMFTGPAHAQFFDVSINGTMFGSTVTTLCNSGSPAECLYANHGASRIDPYESEFVRALGMISLAEGDNAFSIGHPRATGFYTGTINNSNGYLTGRDLFFSLEDPNYRFAAIGASSTFATASNFHVIGGIPEPGTWAMMLLGFGAIGSQLRRRRKPAQFLLSDPKGAVS